jgi:predicted RNA-binding protein
MIRGVGRTHKILEVEKMCEANAYILKNGTEELLLEDVDKVIPGEDGILLENIFGQQKIIKARIKEMALVNHKIILEKIE